MHANKYAYIRDEQQREEREEQARLESDLRPEPIPIPAPSNGGDFEDLCRKSSISDFAAYIRQLSWDELNKLYTMLTDKVDEINRQIEQRCDANVDWHKRSKVALSFMTQKRDAVLTQINRIKVNSVGSIMARIGGNVESILSNRILMIRCLIHIIQKNISVKSLTDSERALIEVMEGLSDPVLYRSAIESPFSYDYTGNKVISRYGRDIAHICPNRFSQEEYGLLFAFSPLMRGVIADSIDAWSEITGSSRYQFIGENLSSHINDLLSRSKSILSEFP
jgi:hypothetical protein